MKIATIAGRVHVQPDSQQADGWVDVAHAVPGTASTLIELLARGQHDALRAATAHPATQPASAPLETPLQPGQLIDCFAFEGHVRNARARRGQPVPAEWYASPVWYRANPRGLVPPGGTVPFPADETEPDFELELACVIGQRVHSPSREQAATAIFGYTLFNDWSARATQREAMKVGLGPNPGKDFASSLGPVIVTADEFGDPANAELSATVDGEEWCRAQMSEARWDFPALIAAIANGNELLPGDVVCSGTFTNGCGLEHGRVLRDGQVVELHEAHIGTLRGICGRAPPRDAFWKKP